jgi:excisionase family DNA binding protein
MKENLMTVQEVAEHLRLHPVTVYKWAKRGRIPAIRLGYALRFRPSDIRELEEKAYVPAFRTRRTSRRAS